MARGKNNVQVTGDFILRAQMDIGNAEKQAQRIYQVLNKAEFKPQISKTFFTGLNKIETLTGRIKNNLASGTLEGDGLKEYLRDANVLAKEMTNLERALQKVGATDIKIDDSELKYLQSEITVVEQQMRDLKKGFTLDTTGILSTDRNLKQISESIDKAIKNGGSLQATLNNLSQIKQQDIVTQTGKISELEQVKQDAEQAIPKLEELLNKHRELETFLQSPDKRKANRERFDSLMGEAKGALGSEFTSKRQFTDKRVVVAQEILRLEQEIDATKSKADKAGGEIGRQNKVLKGLREYQAVLQQIQAQNQGGIGNFDQEMAELQTDFADVTLQARALGDALAQALIKQLRDAGLEFNKVGAEAKKTGDEIGDFVQKTDEEIKANEQATNSFKNKITQIFGLYNVYQLIRRGIQNAYRSIQELDSAMNEIAVVTEMTTAELWSQIETYMAVARQYGVTTKGVYEVAKLYYQQGRQNAEVTVLTAETLKMAKIAGLDYATATDHMTVQLNGFKMGIADASSVVDVYSRLAAISATDTQEIAYAMSKTASIAESAGMSFENTSVFLAQMIETTREAPENIGTAMKTIIARFQEMKKSPLELVNVEGEEVSFNRVDKALQSIGMTLQDASGQFRNLDDVIYELAGKWDSLDRNTQRYIATTVAGSRQQSRFLALMQDSDRLQELRIEALNSEDAGLVQYAKTLDSLESKLAQMNTAFQQFYMSMVNGPVISWVIQAITKIIDLINKLPSILVTAILPGISMAFGRVISNIGTGLIGGFKKAHFGIVKDGILSAKAWKNNWTAAYQEVLKAKGLADGIGPLTKRQAFSAKITAGLATAQSQLSTAAVVASIVTAAMTFIDEQFIHTAEERIEEYKKKIEEANIARATTKQEWSSLVSLKKKWDELSLSKDESNEKTQEWFEINSQIVDQYPELLGYIDSEGNMIADLSAQYETLEKNKRKAYNEALIKQSLEQTKALQDPAYVLKDIRTSLPVGNDITSVASSLFSFASEIDFTTRRKLKDVQSSYSGSKTPDDFLKSAIDDMGFGLWGQWFQGKTSLDNWQQRIEDGTIQDWIAGFTKSEQEVQNYIVSIYESWTYLQNQLTDSMKGTLGALYQDWLFENESLEIGDVQGARIQAEFYKQYKKDISEPGQNIEKITTQYIMDSTRYINEINESIMEIMQNNADTFEENSDRAEQALAREISKKDFTENEAALKIILGDTLFAEIEADLNKQVDRAVNNYSSIFKDINNSEITEEQKKEIEELYNSIPQSLLKLATSHLETLKELDLESNSTNVKRGSEGLLRVVEQYNTILNKTGELPEEEQKKAHLILQNADITSAKGWADLQHAYTLALGADNSFTEAARQAVEEFTITAEQQAVYAVERYKKIGEFNALLEKELDIEQVAKWLDSGLFKVKDFSEDLTKFVNEEAALKLYLGPLEILMEKGLLSGDVVEAVTKRLKNEQRKIFESKQKEIFRALVDSITFDNKGITLTEELYSHIVKATGANKFKSTLTGYEFIGTLEEFISQLKAASLTIEGGSDYLQKALQEVYRSVEEVITNAESIAKDVLALGGFRDKSVFQAVALMTDPQIQTQRTVEEQGVINFERVSAFEALALALDWANINAYNYVNYLEAEYKGLKGIQKLNEQIANFKSEASTKELRALEKNAALQQLAAKRIQLLYDPQSYKFLSNSKTNDDLAPMYAFFGDYFSATGALQEALDNDGKISREMLNGILDFSENQFDDKNMLKELRDIGTAFGDELDVFINDGQISSLQEAMRQRRTETVKEYNEQVDRDNDFLNRMLTTTDELTSSFMFRGVKYGPGEDEISDFGDLLEATGSALTKAERDAVRAGAQALNAQGIPIQDAFVEALRLQGLDDPSLEQLRAIREILDGIQASLGEGSPFSEILTAMGLWGESAKNTEQTITVTYKLSDDTEGTQTITPEQAVAISEAIKQLKDDGLTDEQLEVQFGYLLTASYGDGEDDEAVFNKAKAAAAEIKGDSDVEGGTNAVYGIALDSSSGETFGDDKEDAEDIKTDSTIEDGTNATYKITLNSSSDETFGSDKEGAEYVKENQGSSTAKFTLQVGGTVDPDYNSAKLITDQLGEGKTVEVTLVAPTAEEVSSTSSTIDTLLTENGPVTIVLTPKPDDTGVTASFFVPDENGGQKEIFVDLTPRPDGTGVTASFFVPDENGGQKEISVDLTPKAGSTLSIGDLVADLATDEEGAKFLEAVINATKGDFDEAQTALEELINKEYVATITVRMPPAPLTVKRPFNELSEEDQNIINDRERERLREKGRTEGGPSGMYLVPPEVMGDRLQDQVVEVEVTPVLDTSEIPPQSLDVVVTDEHISEQKQRLKEAFGTNLDSVHDFLTEKGITDEELVVNFDQAKDEYSKFLQEITGSPPEPETELDNSGAETSWSIFQSNINSTVLKPKVELQLPTGPIPMQAAGTDGAKGGKTLVGELGPEMRVSNGRYSVIGRKGPEFVNLRRGDIVLDHYKTQNLLSGSTRTGQALPTGTSNWIDDARTKIKDGAGGSTSTNKKKGENDSTEKISKAEFDRWYNYLQLIGDVERAVSELQQARENLYGIDYTKSLAREIQLLQSQAEVVGKFKQAQETYLQSFENTKIKEYSDYLQVIDGVLQIQWDKLNGMDNEIAEPIKKIIDEWESLTDSISNSTQELENFQATIKKLQDEMRDTYIEVEGMVRDGILSRQQMVIDNLQKELNMKVKYDTLYLNALRKNVEAERKLRERATSEEDRAKLQRRLALLRRDTSGKSDLAIADVEKQLAQANQQAYDQRQDDFMQQEEDALLAAQEALQNEIEIQTEVLSFMSENIELIQKMIDDIMFSGAANLTQFLQNWNEEYQNSTPTKKEEMDGRFGDLSGRVQGYLDVLAGKIDTSIGKINWGLSGNTNLDPNAGGSGAGGGTNASSSSSGSSGQGYWGIYNSGGTRIRTGFRTREAAEKALALQIYNAEAAMTVENYLAQNNTYKEALQEYNKYSGGSVKAYERGGLIDYTGPALVHGSKSDPEMILNSRQTGIFQDFVALLDQNFGRNIQGAMVKPNSFNGAPEQTTVIVENITIESGVIASDYGASRAGNKIKEEILNIAKYKGNMTLKR